MTATNSAVNPIPAPGAAGATPATPAPSASAAAAPAAPAQPVAQPQGTPTPAQPGAMVPLSALHEERQKRQELSAQLEQLTQTVKTLQGGVQPQGQPAPQDNTNQPMSFEAVEKLWEEDPKQAVRAEIMMSFNWYDRMGTTLEIAADNLAARMPDFNTVRGQVMNQVRTLPLNQRTPQAVEHAYYMMRGQNVDAIIRQREQEWQQRQGAPAQFQVPTTGTYGAGPVAPNTGVQLTAEQMSAADAMGMSREEYARNIKVQGGGAR